MVWDTSDQKNSQSALPEYQPPHAMRMGAVNGGLGICQPTGSSNTVGTCNAGTTNTGASDCTQGTTNSIGSCIAGTTNSGGPPNTCTAGTTNNGGVGTCVAGGTVT